MSSSGLLNQLTVYDQIALEDSRKQTLHRKIIMPNTTTKYDVPETIK
jgi:hypothetical protein